MLAVVALLVVAGLVAVPLGGWDHVDRTAAGADRLAPGAEHRAEQFHTAVEGAELLPALPWSVLEPEPGNVYLVVRARLENATERTQSVPGTHLLLRGIGDVGVASRSLERDPGGDPQLQPGLPDEVLFVWEVPADAVTPGDRLEVLVVDTTRARSQVSDGDIWLHPRVGATWEVRVA